MTPSAYSATAPRPRPAAGFHLPLVVAVALGALAGWLLVQGLLLLA